MVFNLPVKLQTFAHHGRKFNTHYLLLTAPCTLAFGPDSYRGLLVADSLGLAPVRPGVGLGSLTATR
jgi:hypothetical protein